jgi:uncharacterized protein (DUF427 family)
MPDYFDDKPMRTPGPDHPIAIEQNMSHVLVWAAGALVADTRDAVTLREAGYQPVQYIPLEDVDSSLLIESDHSTYCPYKGECSYYSIKGGLVSQNAVWQYREPFAAVAKIEGRVAFYTDRVDLIEQRPSQPHG